MAEIKDPENTIIMETTKGRVVIELRPDVAPGHVARIKELTREGAYDGVVFHRVIEDFMAQTGDVQYGKTGGEQFNPSRAGMGGSSKPDLKAEFSDVSHVRGTCSMARSQMPNSANSQFFICFTMLPGSTSSILSGARSSKEWRISTTSSAANRSAIRIPSFRCGLPPTPDLGYCMFPWIVPDPRTEHAAVRSATAFARLVRRAAL